MQLLKDYADVVDLCSVLTILSAVDGRAFGTCDAGGRVASDSQPGSVVFDGFKVLQLGEVSLT